MPEKRCFCVRCIEEGGFDTDGQPVGVLINARHFAAHKLRVAREEAERAEVEAMFPSAAEEEQVHAQMLAFTLADEGPDVNRRPSRPWTSHVNLQDETGQLPSPDLSSSLPINAIVEGITRLRLSDTSNSNPASTNIETRSPETKTSKRERSHHTTKALAVLDSIQSQIHACCEQLSKLPSDDLLSQAELTISRLRHVVENIRRRTPSLDARKSELLQRLNNLEAHIVELRIITPATTAKNPFNYMTDHHFGAPIDGFNIVAQLAAFLGVVCSIIMGVSRRDGDFIMGIITMLLLQGFSIAGDFSPQQEDILAQIPLNITSALSKFNLEGRTTVYAVCPACHCTYEPHYKEGSSFPRYPNRCTNKPRPESSECGTSLLDARIDVSSPKPIKPFVYHHFHDYLAGLLSRQDLEEKMDQSCDDLMAALSDPPPTFVHDIFEAEFLRSFEGPIPNTLFVDRKGSGRYLFSLNVDYFNVEGMRIRGASTSCGIISMACLNLPPDLRYKPENMYLSIIPGPREPHLTQLNYYLKPLVGDLVVSWERGVRFSKTALHPMGRTTHSAVAAVVADLPAARQSTALASHSSHHYCTVCQCYHRDSLGRTDHEKWKIRDNLLLRRHAEQWKDAPTSAEQDKIFKAHGTRWSELWRLPYWNPSRQLVVDTMHCILEGLVEHHFRDVLSLTAASAASSPLVPPPFAYEFQQVDHEKNDDNMTSKEIKQVTSIHTLLVAPVDGQDDHEIEENLDKLKAKLLSRNKKPLQFVCRDLRCEPPAAKKAKSHLAQALVDWRSTKPFRSDEAPPLKLATPEVMERIKNVIRDTTTPSWLGSVPRNFGDPAAGTLKADEWRTMSTVYFPLALISIWGEGTSHDSPDIAMKLREVLDHTMGLVCAVSLGCARSMSQTRATAYLQYMKIYVSDLQNLHPDISHRTIHHMALHIYDFLLLFGPVRAWWCFPFERLIGQIQRLLSNHKFGQMESTLLYSFIKAGRLKCWLGRPDCPPAIKEIKKLFDKIYAPKFHADAGFADESDNLQEKLFADDQTAKATFQAVPNDLRGLVMGGKVILQARVKLQGLIYSTCSAHLGNSLVLFYPSGDKSSPPIPGSIRYIFSQGGKPTFAVHRQLSISDDCVDPFSLYSYFPAKLYSSQLSDTLEIVYTDWVMCHFARWNMSLDHAIVLSLSRD